MWREVAPGTALVVGDGLQDAEVSTREAQLIDAPVVRARCGEARLEVPELATLSVTVHSSGSAAAAGSATSWPRRRARMRALLEDHRAGMSRISGRTCGLHVAPVFRAPVGTRVTGYRGSSQRLIEVPRLRCATRPVFTLTPLPEPAKIDGPWWSAAAGEPRLPEVRLAAMVEARHRASSCAAAVDLSSRAGSSVISDLDPRDRALRRHARMAFTADAGRGRQLRLRAGRAVDDGQVTLRLHASRPELPRGGLT